MFKRNDNDVDNVKARVRKEGRQKAATKTASITKKAPAKTLAPKQRFVEIRTEPVKKIEKFKVKKIEKKKANVGWSIPSSLKKRKKRSRK